MKVSELFPRKWLKPDDLPVQRAARVTIEAVKLEDIWNPRDRVYVKKLVISFAGKTRRLILNKTQAFRLASLFGDESDDWPGQSCTLARGLAPNHQPTIVIGPANHTQGTVQEEQEAS